MDTKADDLVINQIIKSMNDDSLIIFVGAGVSANSGLPTWNQLIDKLRPELGIGINEEDNLKVAQFYFDTWGKQKYFEKISDVFDEYLNAPTNDIHDEIFKIQPRHIITTNYDTLIEKKINEGITKYSIIKTDSDIPYTQANRFLIKMHGDLDTKNIVLKENDYLDYEDNFPMISTLIKSLIMNNTLLFIGYSLGDTTFNSIFRLIHNTFGENTKKSYFYTPKKPKEVVKEYYKKKGIHVLSSENEDIPNKDLGKYTAEFLSEISKKNNSRKVTDHEELWETLNFLDKFNFIESRDVIRQIKLKEKAYLFTPDSYKYGSNQPVFKLPKDSETMQFLENKTWINDFLGNKIEHHDLMGSNNVLLPAFEMYKKNKNNEAKKLFREIANISYRKQDYLNYMIAEFNVSHIQIGIFSEEPELVQSAVNTELSDAIEKIIENSKNDTKKIAIFFRDTILNFNFIYKKMYTINELLDKLKSEHHTIKNGGSSYNNNFSVLQYEFKSFVNFIEKNCICVGQYKEFHMIMNRYFESLVVAFDNSNNMNEKEGQGSSAISELDVDDIRELVPYIDLKLLPIYLNNYPVGKIKITNEAFNHILDKSLLLCDNIDNHFDTNLSLLNRYITFLSYVDLQKFDHKKIIDLFNQFPIYYSNKDELKTILSILIFKSDKFEKNEISDIAQCIEKQIKTIVSKEDRILYNVFNYYNKLLSLLKERDKSIVIKEESIFEKFVILDSKPGKLKDIEKYESFLSNFYEYFEKENKLLVDKLLIRYSKLPPDKKSYFFIIELIESGINKFNDIKDEVLSDIVKRIGTEQLQGVKAFPDPVEMATANLFNLIQHGYFNAEDIEGKGIEKKMKGKNAVVDWVLFGMRSDDIIEKLISNMSFSTIKSEFCKTDEDKRTLDRWAVMQYELGNNKN